tara:strand:- start:749 stop:1690 length:942 start_codon:yes stop_codon:yes gene_type:complete
MKIKNSKIFLAGHKGLVGSAVHRRLLELNYKKIITVNKKKLNLTNQQKVFRYLKNIKPNVVIICAAKVGGIKANNIYRAQFIYENLVIQNNLIHGSFLAGVKKLIFLGSSCVYPKFSKQPIKEEYLLTSELEKTNEPYAIAKISGIKLCESYNKQYKTNYISLMPTNTFGPNDNYDIQNSHFIPALIRKIYEAKQKKKKFLYLWGTGNAKREILHVKDLADAIIYFMNKKINHSYLNIGSNFEKKINEYAKILMKIAEVNLKIKYIGPKYDGTPRKKLNINLAKKYGWKPKIPLMQALRQTYEEYSKLRKNNK